MDCDFKVERKNVFIMGAGRTPLREMVWRILQRKSRTVRSTWRFVHYIEQKDLLILQKHMLQIQNHRITLNQEKLVWLTRIVVI